MERRDFLRFSGTVLANTIFFPFVENRKVSEWFIAVDGGAWNKATGTIDDPFSLDGLRQDPLGLVQPGDIIYFREGYYKTTTPVTQTKWKGTEKDLIWIRPYKKEKVIIDGSVDLFGGYQHWDGFEILNTRWLTRESQQTGSNPTDIGDAYEAFIIDGPGMKITNCDLHDCRQGVRAINDNDLTVENCRIWNNGWNAPDRGHGHGIYANVGPITIRNNWIGKGYSEWGVHVYGASTEQLICEKNELENCMLLAYSIRNGSIQKNTITMDIDAPCRFVDFRNPLQGGGIIWDHNTYIDERDGVYRFSTECKTFIEWQDKWGFDLHSQYWITEENRKSRVMEKIYPDYYRQKDDIDPLALRKPPVPHAAWLKDIENGS